MADSSSFTCPHCGQSYQLTPEQVPQYAGQQITCTVCKKGFQVPPTLPPPGRFAASDLASSPLSYGRPAATSGLAIASLVVGIVGFCVPYVTGLAAIVLGILGIRSTRNQRAGGRGLAIAGLVLGCVSVLMWGLFTIPFLAMRPALRTARARVATVQCASNLRQIGQGCLLYATDNKVYPPDLGLLVTKADVIVDAFVCPAGGSTVPAHISVGTPAEQAAWVKANSDYVYLGATISPTASADYVLAYEKPTAHAGDGMNVLFNDGHTEWIARPAAVKLVAELQAGQNPPPSLPGSTSPPAEQPVESP